MYIELMEHIKTRDPFYKPPSPQLKEENAKVRETLTCDG